MLNEDISKNVQRLDSIIKNSYKECSCCGCPLPSWIEISLSDFCTRNCVFCPKGDSLVAPNQKLFMPKTLAEKIASDISDMEFDGGVTLAGYGEPLSSPHVMDSIKIFSSVTDVEIVTNGDLLTKDKVKQIIENGISFIIVSVYGGSEQFVKLQKMFVDVPESKYVLRKRWYDFEEDYGLKLTNRAGTVNAGNQEEVNVGARCFYPCYSMIIDWNGDVMLCPQDWNRHLKFGNLNFESLHDIWVSKKYWKFRKNLFEGKRIMSPCSECNCSGTFHGEEHAKGWMKIWKN